MGRLEEAVADATTFLVFLSAGYFKSFNCRRELYATIRKVWSPKTDSRRPLRAPARRPFCLRSNTLSFPMALKIGSERSGVGVNLLL